MFSRARLGLQVIFGIDSPLLEMAFRSFISHLARSLPLRRSAQRRFCNSDSRARPASVVGPVEQLPCKRHRPFRIDRRRHLPPTRVRPQTRRRC